MGDGIGCLVCQNVQRAPDGARSQSPVSVYGTRVENTLLPKQRIDAQGIPAEHVNPVDPLETVGQLLRPLDVAQPHERIVEFRVLDVVTIELPSQPLVPVDVDLDLKREPTLELDVDEPQVSAQEVVVEVETLAPRSAQS